VGDTIRERVRREGTTPGLVVLDLSAAPYVDMQAAQTLAAVADDLHAVGVRLQVVEPRSSVRDRLRAEAVDTRLGGANRFATVADAVDAFQRVFSKMPAP
jgi:MFS superfamily sulfate permease-like transporter